MLSVREISKSYPQRGTVLDRLTLEAEEGDTIAIMGPSGSGKTTLLNIIGLLDRPDAGHVFIKGKDILGFNDNEAALYRNRNIGFVFQDHLLLPHLTIKENITLPLLASRISAREHRERDEYASHLMKRIGISGLEDKYPSEISGGEAQRTALVRSLVNKPAILLADEPTGSLDAGNAKALGELLSELNQESSVILILATHSEKLAEKMGRIYTLDGGRLVLN